MYYLKRRTRHGHFRFRTRRENQRLGVSMDIYWIVNRKSDSKLSLELWEINACWGRASPAICDTSLQLSSGFEWIGNPPLTVSHQLWLQPTEETHFLDHHCWRGGCLDRSQWDKPSPGSEIHLLQEHHSRQSVSHTLQRTLDSYRITLLLPIKGDSKLNIQGPALSYLT